MEIISTALLRLHCRLDDDETSEDSLLEAYRDTAIEQIQCYCNRNVDDIIAEYGAVPASLKTAIAMYVQNRYTHRGDDNATLPPDIVGMVNKFKKLTNYSSQ